MRSARDSLSARMDVPWNYGTFIFYRIKYNLRVPQAGPYLGILRPWAQENFAPPPPYLFVLSYV
jgi:hypothetical protein